MSAQHPSAKTTPQSNTLRPKRDSLVSRNITVSGRRTSIRLEPEMWNAYQELCRRERMNMHAVATRVATAKPENASLTAALRVFIMGYYRSAATDDGHCRAGHGQGMIGMARPTLVPMAPASPPLSLTTASSPTTTSHNPYRLGQRLASR